MRNLKWHFTTITCFGIEELKIFKKALRGYC